VLRRLRDVGGHKHLVELHATYTLKRHLYLVTQPVCDANLWDYLVRVGHASVDIGGEGEFNFRLFDWMNCLASGIKYLHNYGILHLDIKPQNILVRGTTVLLTDFGCSFTKAPDAVLSGLYAVGHPGTPEYAAPEQRSTLRTYVGTKAEVFALACIFAELFVTASGIKVSAFRKARHSRNDGYFFTQGRDYSFAGNVAKAHQFLQKLEGSSENLRKLVPLISDMWKLNPDDRPKIRAVMERLNSITTGAYPERELCCTIPRTPSKG